VTTRTVLVYLLLLLPVAVFIGFSLVELFRRRDIRGLARAAWAVAIIVVPVGGSVAYLFARPSMETDIAGFGTRPDRTTHGPLLQAVELAARPDPSLGPADLAAERMVLRARLEALIGQSNPPNQAP
jgi:hypothetical protein